MFPAVGMVEFSSLGAGIEASDAMVKAASVNPLFFKTICPGKFLAAVSGDVAAVPASVAAGREKAAAVIVDWLVIPNIHPRRADRADRGGFGRPARGVSASSRPSRWPRSSGRDAPSRRRGAPHRRAHRHGPGRQGLRPHGRRRGAVRAAVAAGAAGAAESGLLVRQVVIPKPHADVYAHVL
jgi:microcompartment protein CcmL/EutN